MKVYPYKMKCKRNLVNKYNNIENLKDGNSVIEWDCAFKYGGSILNIEIIAHLKNTLQKKILTKCNYVYIPDLNRYYFVDNIEFLNGTQIKLTLSEDVLYTYSDSILTTAQMIRRNAYTYNGMYQDEKYPVQQNKISVVKNFTNIPFNKNDMTSSKRCIALTVSGGGI